MTRSSLAVSPHSLIDAILETSGPRRVGDTAPESLDEAFARIDELLELEPPPTRRVPALVRDVEACAHPADEERPTLTVSPQESIRLLATAFAANDDDDDITLDAPSPVPVSSIARVEARLGTMAPERNVAAPPSGQTLLIAGIWAMTLSLIAVLAFFLTDA